MNPSSIPCFGYAGRRYAATNGRVWFTSPATAGRTWRGNAETAATVSPIGCPKFLSHFRKHFIRRPDPSSVTVFEPPANSLKHFQPFLRFPFKGFTYDSVRRGIQVDSFPIRFVLKQNLSIRG